MDNNFFENLFGSNNECAADLYQRLKHEPLRALSVRQPWAGLLVYGLKTIETRTWATMFRGVFLIHASGQVDRHARSIMKGGRDVLAYCDMNLQRGAVIGVARIHDCIEMLPEHEKFSCCKYSNGLFSHVVADAFPVEPIEMKGKLNYFQTDISLADLKPLSNERAMQSYSMQLSL